MLNTGETVANEVCKDLVLYNDCNPFYELIPMAYVHPILVHIIVANAAFHMSNVSQKSICTKESAGLKRLESHQHALQAKQKALHLLQASLASNIPLDADVTLAVILLFVECELIDSGQGSWRRHTSGARKLIETLCESELSTQTLTSPLRRCLISNTLMYV